MSSWPNPLSPSPSNLSHTLTGTHTHYQHISPHWHLPHSVQAGPGNPTAQKTYIKHFSFRKLQTCLSPSIRSEKHSNELSSTRSHVFLSQNNKLDAKQSGFRSGHSTETALLSVTEPCELQRPIPNHQSLIRLDLSAGFDTVNHQILLSTLSSLGITGFPLRWFESYLTGRSFRVAWGGEVSKAHQLVTGVPQGSVLGPLLFSTYTTSLGPIIQAHGFSYHCYADDTHLSFQPDDPTVAARISGCLADISAWMKEHHLQLNLAKTELLVFPATLTLQHDFLIQLGTSIITPSTSVRNLGVIFDLKLTFKEHIAKTARSCRFALHNIRKSRPFLTKHATQLLFQALVVFRLDYCNALLAGLPSNTIKPLQMIQNAAARLVFNEPKRAHALHLLALAPGCSSHQVQDIDACIQNDHRLSTTSTHYYESTSPPEVWDLLVSDALWYHHREAQNHSPEHSHSPFLDGGIIFPPLSGMLDSCQSSSNNWKLISFDTTWLHPKLNFFFNFLILYLFLPLLACTYLNNDWDLVLRALPLSVCLFKMNRFMSSPIVSRFG